MRILRESCWLAVLALALGAANGSKVTFTRGSFEGTFGIATQAIKSFESATAFGFEWTADNVTVEEVNIFVRDLKANSGSDKVIASGKIPGSMGEGPALVKPTSTTILPSSTATLHGGGGILKHRRRDLPKANEDLAKLVVAVDGVRGSAKLDGETSGRIGSGQPLYLEVKWTGGASYSRLFTLLHAASELDLVKGFLESLGNDSPVKPDSITPVLSPDTTGVPTTTGTSSPDASKSDGGGSGLSSGGGGGGGGGGLSSGAIIGIAVACGVIGLALIFGAVFWFVRRRKQQKELLPVNSSYGSGRTEDLMVQKEANTEVDVTPHSPYSDEGAPSAGPGEAVAAGAAGSTHRQHAQGQSRSFTPYSDRPSAAGPGTAAAGTPSVRAASVAHTTGEEARVSVPSPTPGRATPRALSTPYAHLVEEGMTEEEIRRLEDEERQLDAAIEQAGRRP